MCIHVCKRVCDIGFLPALSFQSQSYPFLVPVELPNLWIPTHCTLQLMQIPNSVNSETAICVHKASEFDKEIP